MGRREQVLDAAVEVLAERGGRGFSHRAVETAAGAPAGTASNYFTTRRDLLRATFDRVVERQGTARQTMRSRPPVDEAELVAVLGAMTEAGLTSMRAETVTHGLLSLEAAGDPEFAAQVRSSTGWWRSEVSGWLRRLGAADPDTGADLIANYISTVVLVEHAAPRSNFDPIAALEPLVWGLLH